MHVNWAFIQVFLLELAQGAALKPRIDNGLAKTPPMGYVSASHRIASAHWPLATSQAKKLT